jgi:hypothetical protein
MRTILKATFIAAVACWVGATTGSAAPINATTLENAASGLALTSHAYYHWRHGRLCYSKCYREFIVGPRVCRRFC